MTMTSDEGQVTFASSRAVLDNPHHLRLFLQRMRNDANTHDVIFVVNGERFPAHRSLMCCVSPVLRSMLTNGMKKSKRTKMELRELDVDAWKSIVDYIYAVRIGVVSVDHAPNVLESACSFHIEELERGLSEYRMEQMLRKKEMEVVANDFHDVCVSVEFTGLSHGIVWDLVNCRNLIISGKIHVFLGIMVYLLSSDVIEEEDAVHYTIKEQEFDLLKEVDIDIDGFSDEGKGPPEFDGNLASYVVHDYRKR